MKPQSYWQKRSEQVAKRQHAKSDKYAASLGREYGRAMQSVSRDIESFYGRYAVNNEISLGEARKLLTKSELSEFKMSLEEFTAKAKNNADGRWTQQLNNAYYRTRVSRLEALQLQIRQQVEMLAGSRQQGLGSLLGDVYEDTYYRTMFEIQRGTGIGASFARLDDTGMHKVLGTEFAGSNWSKRIWADRDKLANELHTKLTQSFIRGDSVDRTIRDVRDRFNVSHSNARRLVQTESAFFTEQATMDSYKESGVIDQYEILATLDGITSPICREMDGKVFKLSEQEVGVTFPPFHVNCRTTTVPYFDDEEDVGERIARDEDGQTYYVPGDMKYEEWYNDYADNVKDSGLDFTQQAKSIYGNWDKNNRTMFANDILKESGSDLKVNIHNIDAYGQCQLNIHEDTMSVLSFELNSRDIRSQPYQVKTVFHELFHAKSHGLKHDALKIGMDKWAYYDDVFAESFAHYMAKGIGITAEIAPSYAGHLVKTLPRLKALPEFKNAKTISDFGKVAHGYRFGNGAKASWGDLIDVIEAKNFDISTYSQPYAKYIRENADELIDKMLENMPQFAQYKNQMLGDLDSALTNGFKWMDKNEEMISNNVLIIAMNRLGVNGL